MFSRRGSRIVHESGSRVAHQNASVLRTAFLHRLTERHAVSDTEFLTDAGGYLTALARLDLHGGLDYSERNLVEKWFQTVTMRIDCIHSFWRHAF